ncbi:MAG: serine/threonine protein phosphatase [Flavobacterium sp.]|nr:serine/threonine protein phosphatase [Flavobacterium sp.]
MKRKLVIGDVHGGLKALHQILERAKVSEDDQLIFLGDYVDGWSQSPQVLDFLIDLKKSHNCIYIRGNHDDLLSEWLRGKENVLWHEHGGLATIKAYKSLTETDKQRHISFLELLETYHIDEQNRLFVHAGFTNQHGVLHEFYPRLMFWDRTLWEMVSAMDKSVKKGDLNFPRRLTHYHEIFIGHTPVTKLGKSAPLQMANVWNVDTGAAFKGRLSIMDVDTKEYWQSDPLPELYPDERGRN